MPLALALPDGGTAEPACGRASSCATRRAGCGFDTNAARRRSPRLPGISRCRPLGQVRCARPRRHRGGRAGHSHRARGVLELAAAAGERSAGPRRARDDGDRRGPARGEGQEREARRGQMELVARAAAATTERILVRTERYELEATRTWNERATRSGRSAAWPRSDLDERVRWSRMFTRSHLATNADGLPRTTPASTERSPARLRGSGHGDDARCDEEGGMCIEVPDVCKTPAAEPIRSRIRTRHSSTARRTVSTCSIGNRRLVVESFQDLELIRRRSGTGGRRRLDGSRGRRASNRYSSKNTPGKRIVFHTATTSHNGSNPNMPAGPRVAVPDRDRGRQPDSDSGSRLCSPRAACDTLHRERTPSF